jgi:hypothetical protein
MDSNDEIYFRPITLGAEAILQLEAENARLRAALDMAKDFLRHNDLAYEYAEAIEKGGTDGN